MTLEGYEKIAHRSKAGDTLLADTLLRLVREVRELHEATEPIRLWAPSPKGECGCGGDALHAVGCAKMVRWFVAAHPQVETAPATEGIPR